MGTDIHLLLATSWRDRFDWSFAYYGTFLGLAVDILTYLATNLGVDSEYFCHCVVPFVVKSYTFC